MVNTTETNNGVVVVGTVVSALELSHQIAGEKFFSFRLSTERLSGNADIISVTISERLLLTGQPIHEGQKVSLKGQVRTYNQIEHNRRSLIITLFVLDYACCVGVKDSDEVELTGFICKQPIYRKTPFGREIADVILAVNRAYNKSDYIPVILWGRNARFINTLKVGDLVKVCGRLQSREYQKQTADGPITKIAYEISVTRVEKKDA